MYEIRPVGQLIRTTDGPSRQSILRAAVTQSLEALALQPFPTIKWNVEPASFDEMANGALEVATSLAQPYEFVHFALAEVRAELVRRGYVPGMADVPVLPEIPLPENGGDGGVDLPLLDQREPVRFPLWLLLLVIGALVYAGG